MIIWAESQWSCGKLMVANPIAWQKMAGEKTLDLRQVFAASSMKPATVK
jgi:hypothetical protein